MLTSKKIKFVSFSIELRTCERCEENVRQSDICDTCYCCSACCAC
jgi:hypothetical protein